MSRGGYALRRRLIWLVAGAVLVVGFLSMLVVYQRAHHEADELLDTQLAQLAETLLAIAEGGEIDHFAGEMRQRAQRHAVPIAFEIWIEDRGTARRLATSPGHSGFATPIPPGYSDRIHRDQHWRLFSIRADDAAYTVVVGQRHSARDRLARETGLSLLLPLLLALPLMALGVRWAVGRALEPIDALTRQIAALDADTLKPLDTAPALPDEIAPLRRAFNALVERVAAAFENERRFTADAAHELRTPLAALKVQAQVAQRTHDSEARRHALAQVIAGVDRMTHLVEQLLTLARIEPGNQNVAQPAPYDPAPRLTRLCDIHVDTAAHRSQTLVCDFAAGCHIAMEPAWLDIVARNLIDNAMNYAGDGARIEVRLFRDGDVCALQVADDGPGVPDDLRAHLVGRFARGETNTEGCGLGLSIVERIAQLSRVRLEFGAGLARPDGGHGFAATLRFEAAPEADAHTR